MRLKNYVFYFFLIINTFTFPAILTQIKGQQTTNDLPNPYSLIKDHLKKNNYITPIYELKAREEKYLASQQLRMSYLEWIIQLEGYVGNYEEVYRYEDILYSDFPTTKNIIEQYKNDITDIKNSPIVDYKMHDANVAINSIAGREQVIMINEEHRTPFHRAFTQGLLANLYTEGFRYFAAETINETDTNLNQRRYPTQNSGTYTADPVYADAVRTALRIGYKVVAYESSDSNCKSPENNPDFCNDRREREQAQNLYERILKNDPKAKILVHVGRGHNSKAKISEQFNFMGYYFKEISKIDPFTIDQLRFSERRNAALEQPLYRFLTKNDMLQKPSVYQTSDGRFYSLGYGYDMVIFHPRMSFKNGRPVFLEMGGMRKAQKINAGKLNLRTRNNIYNEKEPVLIQAFFKNESENAIPFDQIVLEPNEKIPPLMLQKGAFRIRVMNKTGNVLKQYEETID